MFLTLSYCVAETLDCHFLPIDVLLVIGTVFLLYNTLGWPAIVACVMMLFLFPLEGAIASKIRSKRADMMRFVLHWYCIVLYWIPLLSVLPISVPPPYFTQTQHP